MEQKKETDDELKKEGKVKDDKRQPEKKLPAHVEDVQQAARLAAEPGVSSPQRARKMTLLQKKLGNTQTARMLSNEEPKQATPGTQEGKRREQDHAPAEKTSEKKPGE